MNYKNFSIGLTGGIGSGKTLVANMFADLGASVVDADEVARNLTAPGGEGIGPIRKEFGSQFIRPDGAMDRAMMREHVFSACQGTFEAGSDPSSIDQGRFVTPGTGSKRGLCHFCQSVAGRIADMARYGNKSACYRLSGRVAGFESHEA